MNNEEIGRRVREIIRAQLDLDENVSFVQIGADSLDRVEIVLALETEFDIAIADRDVDQIQTVGGAVAYVKRALATRGDGS